MRLRPLRTTAFLACSALAAGAGLVAAGGSVASGAHRTPPRARAAKAAPREYTIKVDFKHTAQGKTHGNDVTGIEGHGTFSAKLGPLAMIDVYAEQAVTGVPLTKVVKGGSFEIRENQSPGKMTGTVVVKFKDKSLGTLCATYSENSFTVINGYFIPVLGTLTAAGGSGAASKWHVVAHYHVSSLAAGKTENFGSNGSLNASIGSSRPLKGTCKSVSKQH